MTTTWIILFLLPQFKYKVLYLAYCVTGCFSTLAWIRTNSQSKWRFVFALPLELNYSEVGPDLGVLAQDAPVHCTSVHAQLQEEDGADLSATVTRTEDFMASTVNHPHWLNIHLTTASFEAVQNMHHLSLRMFLAEHNIQSDHLQWYSKMHQHLCWLDLDSNHRAVTVTLHIMHVFDPTYFCKGRP